MISDLRKQGVSIVDMVLPNRCKLYWLADDFMFELTRDEYNSLRSQIVILDSKGRGKYAKYQPFAFSELGVAMLSSVLNSDTAIEINRSIMRAFVAVRQLIISSPENEIKELKNEMKKLKKYIEEVFTDYNDINEDTRMQIELINETLAEMQVKNKELNKPHPRIGFAIPE